MLAAVAKETSIHVQDVGRLYNLVSGERLEITLCYLLQGNVETKPTTYKTYKLEFINSSR